MAANPSRAALALLGLVLVFGLSAGAEPARADSGYPSVLTARYGSQRVEPQEVAFCPGRGSLAPCFATRVPFTFAHRLLLGEDARRTLLLRSPDPEPTPREVWMTTREGHTLGHVLPVVPLDHGTRVADEGYIGHRRWKIELPRCLPQALYMITGEVSYPSAAFYDFAFGASDDPD